MALRFIESLPGVFLGFDKEREIKVAKSAFFIKIILPREEKIVVFVNERVVREDVFILVGGADIKDKDTVIGERFADTGKAGLYVSGSSEIVHAVKAADHGFKADSRLKLSDVLLRQTNLDLCRIAFLLRERKHFGGEIESGHSVASFCERNSNASRTASKIKDLFWGDPVFGEARLVKITPRLVVDILHDPIVIGCEDRVLFGHLEVFRPFMQCSL